MLLKAQILLLINALVASSCGVGSSFRAGTTAPSKKPIAEGTPTTPVGDTVIPPVPVAGSFLTGVLNLPDGSVAKQTSVTVVETDYKTKTNDQGAFTVPISKIPQSVPTLKINVANKTVNAQWVIPADIAPLIEAARSAGAEVRELSRRVGIILTDSIINAGASDKPELTTVSLPTPTGSSSAQIEIWRDVQFDGSAGRAQFIWGNAQTQSGIITIISGKSSTEKEISAWDGDPLKLPALANVFQGYESCTDRVQSSANSGTFSAAPASKCAFDLSQSPFAIGGGYSFKLSVKLNDKTLVSPLFNALPSDKSPKTFSIAGQYSLIVPNGTTSITFKVWGAGGDGQGENNASCSPVDRSGGGGGYAQGNLAVAEGKVISIWVGDSVLGSPVGLSEFGAGTGGQSSSVYYENEIIAMAGGGGGAGQAGSGGGGGGGNSSGLAGETSAVAGILGGVGATLTGGCNNIIWSTEKSNGCPGDGRITNQGNRGGGGGAGFFGGLGGSGNSDLGNCTGSGGGGGSGYLHPNTTSRISLNGSSGSPTGALAVNRSDPHYSAGTGGSGQPGSVTIIFN